MDNTISHTDSTQNPASLYYLRPSYHDNLKLVNIVFDGVGYGE